MQFEQKKTFRNLNEKTRNSSNLKNEREHTTGIFKN